MRSHIALKYDQRVPRYTSYPTAPHFQTVSDGGSYGQWLANLPAGVKPSLYFHIPFCDSMCWFCGCYTKIVKRHEPVADYLAVLSREVEVVADHLSRRFAAQHLHFGGGSPTMLSGDEFDRFISHIGQRFDVDGATEVAVELDPRTATEDYVAALARAGVNRASIGVQDFDDQVQQAINRIQPFDVTERVVNWLRKHGIERINLDLLYGLPFQTEDRVLSMVELAHTLAPTRIALFGYAHVPWMKSHMKMIDEAALPDTLARWRQFELASSRLTELGYAAIGLDHFARPDDALAIAHREKRLHRNFQGYTTDQAAVLIGMGASAIGALPDGYVQNHLPLRDYRRAIESGQLATAKLLAFQGDDRLRGEIIERLMCDLEVDLAEICQRHQVDPASFAAELQQLAPLAEDGLLRITGHRITLEGDGRPLVRLAAAAFDRYLDHGQKRHSKAV